MPTWILTRLIGLGVAVIAIAAAGWYVRQQGYAAAERRYQPMLAQIEAARDSWQQAAQSRRKELQMLQQAYADQQRSVEELQQRETRLQEAKAQALAEAEASVVQYESRIARLSAIATGPKPQGDSCANAMGLARGIYRELLRQ